MGIREIKRELDPLTSAQLILPVLILSFFLLVPLTYMVARAFFHRGSLSLYYFSSLLENPDFIRNPPNFNFLRVSNTSLGTFMFIGDIGPDLGILPNSILVSAFVTLFSAVLGLISAFIIARYNFPGKSVFRVLLLVPMLATPFVNAFVMGKVLGTNGLYNFIFHDILHLLPIKVQVSGLPAVVLIQTISFFPIVYLNVMSSLISIDPSMEEQAESLGAGGFRIFRDITLPLSTPGLAAGSALVFIISLEDLGAPIGLSGAFGSGLHQRLISFYIYNEFRKGLGSVEQVHASTYASAVIMLFIATAVFILIRKYVTLRRYAMMSKGGRFNPRVRKLGWKGIILAYIFLISLILTASFPQIGTFVLAVTDWAYSGSPLPTELTSKFLESLFERPDVLRAITNSLIYSSAATFIMLLAGTSSAYVIARRKIPGKDFLDSLVTIPIAVPGVILAVGYLLFFSFYASRSMLDPFINPGLLLIFTYTARRIPFTTRSVFAGLQQTHESLEEASLNLGAGRGRTFVSIVIPLISQSVIGGSLLSFVYSMNEVSTSITLSSLRPEQGPITFYMSQVVYSSGAVGTVSIAAALAVLLMTIQLIVMTISTKILKQRVAFLGV